MNFVYKILFLTPKTGKKKEKKNTYIIEKKNNPKNKRKQTV
jgi:hypothetical protein